MNSKKIAKKTKLVGPITYSCWFGFKMAQKSPKKSKTMIWTEFLKVHLQAQLNLTNPPDIHPPNPLNRPDQPEPINRWLTNGLSVNLFSTDGQQFCPIPDPPNPSPPLYMNIISNLNMYLSIFCP